MSGQRPLYVMSRTRLGEFQQVRFVSNETYSLSTSDKYVVFSSWQGQTSAIPAETSAPETLRHSFWETYSSSSETDTVTLDSRSGYASFTFGPAPSPTFFTIYSTRYFIYDLTLTGVATPSRFYTFHKEREAFLLMREKLMSDQRFMGKYVAVLHGQIVDSDTNKAVLAKRVYETHGYVPIYITQVTDQPTKRLENPSPEIMHSS
jgi:hypothetical protein